MGEPTHDPLPTMQACLLVELGDGCGQKTTKRSRDSGGTEEKRDAEGLLFSAIPESQEEVDTLKWMA